MYSYDKLILIILFLEFPRNTSFLWILSLDIILSFHLLPLNLNNLNFLFQIIFIFVLNENYSCDYVMFDVTQLLYSIIIGIVQGIAEWVPVSSKTQVLIVSSFLYNFNPSEAYTFGLFKDIGTIIASIIYFRKELLLLFNVLIGKGTDQDKELFKFVVIATVVTGIVAVPLYLFVKDAITGVAIGIPMIIIGLVLIGDAIFIYYSRTKRSESIIFRKFKNLTWKDYVIIGFVQGIAALPGVSRSGITTSTMLVMDIEPEECFRLSFLISIFASIGAFGVTLVFSRSDVASALGSLSLIGLVISIIVATIVSLFFIDFLIKIAGKTEIIYLTSGLGIIAIVFGLLYVLFQL